jgi:glycosyltransferase involved in cell wall biosynthesis
MNKPFITIVTPSFNQAKFLGECLASVEAQQVGSIEHLVFDGGSCDESVELLKGVARDPRFADLRWVSEKDKGQSHAINKGFRVASGEVIGWLNADDRYRPNCLSSIIKAFRDHPNIDVIYGDYTWINEDGTPLQLRREISFSAFVLLYHRVLYIPTTAMFFRRRILDDGQLLNEDLHYAMDFEFFVRLNRLGYRFMHISKVLADFRFHAASKSVAFAERQLAEQEQITRQYSRILGKCSPRWTAPILSGLRTAAALRRYSEKALRGYYFSQFQSL